MDGFIYIFAVIGIAVTAVTSALGIAVIVTMARLTFTRLTSVIPTLFAPVGVVGDQRLDVPQDEQVTVYAEKTRISGQANGSRKPSVNDMGVPVTE